MTLVQVILSYVQVAALQTFVMWMLLIERLLRTPINPSIVKTGYVIYNIDQASLLSALKIKAGVSHS